MNDRYTHRRTVCSLRAGALTIDVLHEVDRKKTRIVVTTKSGKADCTFDDDRVWQPPIGLILIGPANGPYAIPWMQSIAKLRQDELDHVLGEIDRLYADVQPNNVLIF